MKTLLVILALPATLLLTSQTAGAHCQVPCGIYDDHARIHAMKEDVTTIAKAVKLIGELAEKSDAVSKNQLNRWIQTKEIHASRIITTVSEYFLTQKIKPPTKVISCDVDFDVVTSDKFARVFSVTFSPQHDMPHGFSFDVDTSLNIF